MYLCMSLVFFSDKEEAVHVQSLIKSKPKFCRHCDVTVINPGVRKKKSEMLFLTKEEQVGVWLSRICT